MSWIIFVPLLKEDVQNNRVKNGAVVIVTNNMEFLKSISGFAAVF